jgi:hypothetical protein
MGRGVNRGVAWCCSVPSVKVCENWPEILESGYKLAKMRTFPFLAFTSSINLLIQEDLNVSLILSLSASRLSLVVASSSSSAHRPPLILGVQDKYIAGVPAG